LDFVLVPMTSRKACKRLLKEKNLTSKESKEAVNG